MPTMLAPATTATAVPKGFLKTIDDVQEFRKSLHRLGYLTNSLDLLTQLWLAIDDVTLKRDQASAIMLEGPPGTGKTHAAKSVAKLTDALRLEFQFTQGVGREVMMHDVDIAAVVTKQVEAAAAAASGGVFAGVKPEDLIVPGILQVALEASLTQQVVLLLDEVDKAKPYVDSMLLQFLQDCAIAHPTERGKNLVGNPKNLLVFLTKNNERGLTEPLMRRCRTIKLDWPEADTEKAIVKKLALAMLEGRQFRGDIDALASSVISFAARIRKAENSLRKVPSSPEVAQAIVDAVRVPQEARGMVVCHALFKYREDYEEYNKARKGTDDEVSDSKVKALLPRF